MVSVRRRELLRSKDIEKTLQKIYEQLADLFENLLGLKNMSGSLFGNPFPIVFLFHTNMQNQPASI